MTLEATSLPFKEAVDFFRQKVNLPTARWPDILHGAHTRAFTVAGATKDALLVGFREAVDKAISQGTTLEAFRGDFDRLVKAHGWDYNGTRGWRTKVIYETNLRTAYAAGRWAQMTDPDVLRQYPYLRYVHDDSVKHARPEHKAWDGLVLLATDPWWKTHYPPNGWGCMCSVEPISRRELKALGKDGPDKAPPIELRRATLNTSDGPVEVEVPKGIDPGWGYHVGESAYGWRLTAEERKARPVEWTRLTEGDWSTAGRPERLEPQPAVAKPLAQAPRDEAAVRQAIVDATGAEQQVYTLPTGDPVLVDAGFLAGHLPKERGALAPLIPELLTAPEEVWLAFERDETTGKVRLVKRVVKVVAAGPDRTLIMVTEAVGGIMRALTFFSNRGAKASDLRNFNARVRVGKLVYARR